MLLLIFGTKCVALRACPFYLLNGWVYQQGAITFRITAFSIITFSIITFSIMTFSMTISITTFSITTFSITTYSIMTLDTTTFCITMLKRDSIMPECCNGE